MNTLKNQLAEQLIRVQKSMVISNNHIITILETNHLAIIFALIKKHLYAKHY